MDGIIRPTFVVNKNICLKNIEQMVKKAADNKVRLRPHFKTHQSATIGEWFKRYNIDAITVSSTGMAEYFASHGWDDITIAFPLNIHELSHIKRLSENIKLNVLVENTEAAEALAKSVHHNLGVYIKIDTGYRRTGIPAARTGIIDAVLKTLSANKKLVFKGFLTHSGNTYQTKSVNEIFSIHFDSLLKLKKLKQKYSSTYPHLEVSIGDTPSASLCTTFDGVDEIRPGNFVFYDLMQHNLGVCSMEDIAVRLVCPVVSKHASRNEVVIYGGAVHLSKDSVINTNGKRMYGRIVIHKNGEKILLDTLNYVSALSQEHGILKVAQNQFASFTPGDLVEIIPVHSCLTANLFRNYLTTEGEVIETVNT